MYFIFVLIIVAVALLYSFVYESEIGIFLSSMAFGVVVTLQILIGVF